MVMVIHEHELAFEFVQDRRRLRHLKKRHCQLLNGTTLRCSEQRVARHMLSWDKRSWDKRTLVQLSFCWFLWIAIDYSYANANALHWQ